MLKLKKEKKLKYSIMPRYYIQNRICKYLLYNKIN